MLVVNYMDTHTESHWATPLHALAQQYWTMSQSASPTDIGTIVVWFSWISIGDITVTIGAWLNILLSDRLTRLMHDVMDQESESNTWLFQILPSKTTKKIITACWYYYCIHETISKRFVTVIPSNEVTSIQ